ncbi:MAG: hypothetical protein LBQ22_05685 [Bacteroidales bacterium]|jgi:hypothetical protein|nr:hypothetical protein [Bacteroidales bacterium]
MVITSYQYPQYLYAFNNDEETEQLPNGSWKETIPSWELKAACREETNGKGSTIQTVNGEILVFASLIQIPKGTVRINEGTEIIVTREEVNPNQLLEPDFIDSAKISGLVIAKGICQKYDFGRLHCRLWI